MFTDTMEARDEGASDWLDAGDFLRLEMARQGVNAVSLAKKIGISAQSIYNVTGETRRPISAGLAYKLAQELGGSVEFWLGNRFPNFESTAPAGEETKSGTSGVLVDWRILDLNGKHDDNGFFLSPLDPARVQGTSIDLSVGLIVTQNFNQIPKESRDCWFSFYEIESGLHQFSDHQKRYYEQLRARKGIKYCSELLLRPGKSVVIVAGERVRMGSRHFGLLGQVSEMNLKGLIVHCGQQIDPGFNGPLVFRVKNDTDEPIAIKRGDDLASLALVALPEAVRKTYSQNASQIRSLIGKLQTMLTDRVEMTVRNQGCVLRFAGKSFADERPDQVISQFFAWIDKDLAHNGAAIHEAISRLEIGEDDIASLGLFLDAEPEAIADAQRYATMNERARQFVRVIPQLMPGLPEATAAYRRVFAELGELVKINGGFEAR